MLLEREIRSQAGLMASEADAARAADVLREVEYIVIAARGSSDNAARYAQYLLGQRARLPVGLATPWLYSREQPPLLSGGAVMAISQSGRSPDVLGVVAAARSQGRPTIVLTNDASSPLASLGDVVVPLLAGDERSVAATKTYMASLHAVARIAGVDPFPELSSLVESVANAQLATRSRFDPLADATFITVCGRGLNYATACETALKLRELSGIPAEALSPPDLMHGPVAALGPAGWLWAVEPDGDLLDEAASRGVHTVVVSADEAALARATVGVRVPRDVPDWAAPFLMVLPGQAAALRLAELRGVAVDAPHGLAKVTLTS